MVEIRKNLICLVDGEEREIIDGVLLQELDIELQNKIRHEFPNSSADSFICLDHLLKYRLEKIDKMLLEKRTASKHVNNKLTHILTDKNFKVVNVNKHQKESYTFGQKIADNVAHFGGSWGFIIVSICAMILWITTNTIHLFNVHFDPYPFILLNLFLSMVAALQAPLILMSQNRSSDYDRLHADNDFHVNLKTEEEMRVLHAKIDRIIQKDNPDLFEVQKMQTKMLGELQRQINELNNHQKNNEK
ncbi:membrane protein [Leuconostoc litchii]|uniref:DUF1003 domain-containing protein n=1 Tax=Leuconostoc litchii TaxID=1981069 RepID=A0A6P2CQN8_9LACO|nr:DUF1003 domain-containing protein [Leuconostoc litchii]TYC47432.1 DUF1003 domain-containing protein [Leuconostoc litchii]GMA69448.1 membrane protein [Leuconostoc litchii]